MTISVLGEIYKFDLDFRSGQGAKKSSFDKRSQEGTMITQRHKLCARGAGSMIDIVGPSPCSFVPADIIA